MREREETKEMGDIRVELNEKINAGRQEKQMQTGTEREH